MVDYALRVTAISARDSGFVGLWNRLHWFCPPPLDPMQTPCSPCYAMVLYKGSPWQSFVWPFFLLLASSSCAFVLLLSALSSMMFVKGRRWKAAWGAGGKCTEAPQFLSVAIPFHAISCHVMPFHAISWHFMPFHASIPYTYIKTSSLLAMFNLNILYLNHM